MGEAEWLRVPQFTMKSSKNFHSSSRRGIAAFRGIATACENHQKRMEVVKLKLRLADRALEIHRLTQQLAEFGIGADLRIHRDRRRVRLNRDHSGIRNGNSVHFDCGTAHHARVQ
jgi:hypothetical protein